MDSRKVPPVTNPSLDVGQALSYLMGDTGGLQEQLGGFRIKVYHAKAFPWGEVFKMLLYRGMKALRERLQAQGVSWP